MVSTNYIYKVYKHVNFVGIEVKFFSNFYCEVYICYRHFHQCTINTPVIGKIDFKSCLHGLLLWKREKYRHSFITMHFIRYISKSFNSIFKTQSRCKVVCTQDWKFMLLKCDAFYRGLTRLPLLYKIKHKKTVKKLTPYKESYFHIFISSMFISTGTEIFISVFQLH